MADWDDVGRLALELPGAQADPGGRDWRVRGRSFVWERPLRRADLEALGAAAPDGPILGARVEHAGAKEALLADDPSVCFTVPHFDGYPAILVRLERIGVDELRELVTEAWLTRAGRRAARAFLEQRRGSSG
ncbi:MmcQ/YjbR family DNA-binding protein [Baekduia soli]|uniref:MmcQ/YjbR family DNA-binding protein n=1 Tax=Baekduia soli TaxID=496014 RepID=A0A5B8U941_9ACTN|nr:MmcQ/YjbR family DNA-binding protein [Baekduia soli]QEC49515.1 MmcQ/YjbR family DNA-binding protein [Baekduia soli]